MTRCSDNYGPFQFPEKLIPLLLTRAVEGQVLPVYGDGLHVRDWIHVEDHCWRIVDVAERGTDGRVHDFGGDAGRTNLTVVAQILKALGMPRDRVEHVRDRKGHDRRYAMDFSRAETELGWRPLGAFEEGLHSTARWHVENGRWLRRVEGGEYACNLEAVDPALSPSPN